MRDLPKVTQPWAPSPSALWPGLVLRDGTQAPATPCPARLQPWAVHSVFPRSLLSQAGAGAAVLYLELSKPDPGEEVTGWAGPGQPSSRRGPDQACPLPLIFELRN